MAHVHFIGIGGSGLSAIARVLLESGIQVSGSDRQHTPLAEELQAAGAVVYTGHRLENIQDAELVIRSSAVADDNVEVQAALRAGIPVLKRSEYLGQLMAGKRGIAVAGTHGKTTTTAMVAWVLVFLGLDPSYIIGGVSVNLGANAHAGKGDCFVIEADEYDRMFLGLSPDIAVVTNVEHDHPDCYPTPESFEQAFAEFVGRISPGGTLVACSDDRGAAELLRQAAGNGQRTLPYGLSRWLGKNEPQVLGSGLVPNTRGGYDFKAQLAGVKVAVSLQVPGQHNVLNALAALCVASLLGLPLERASQALGEYRGTGRRFQVLGEGSGVTVIDDYAHHPTEIRATLAAARARYTGRTIWVVWQPHTYSRTRTLLDAFTQAFGDADHVLVTAVYAAREAPPEDGFSAEQVVAVMSHPDARLVAGLEQVQEYLINHLHSGDVLLVLSAGDADQVSAGVLAQLAAGRKMSHV